MSLMTEHAMTEEDSHETTRNRSIAPQELSKQVIQPRMWAASHRLTDRLSKLIKIRPRR